MDRAGCSTACTVFRKVSHEEWCAKPDSAHQKIQILSWCSRQLTRSESALTVAHSIQHYIQPGTGEPCPRPGPPAYQGLPHRSAAPGQPCRAGKKVQSAVCPAAPAAGSGCLTPAAQAAHSTVCWGGWRGWRRCQPCQPCRPCRAPSSSVRQHPPPALRQEKKPVPRWGQAFKASPGSGDVFVVRGAGLAALINSKT